MKLLISEIGMLHNGSMDTAKEMIRVSKECGADLVKGQAFNPGDVKGSMPDEFYKQRYLSPMQLMELIDYARSIGTEFFCSIFSKDFHCLKGYQVWHKFSASQSKKNPRSVEASDARNVIASVNPFTMLPDLKLSHVLYACSYLTRDPGLGYIKFLSEYYGRQVGYSDHTIGVDYCIKANKDYGATVIEKHFTLTRDVYHDGKQFRDAVHSALPKELEKLAKAMN